MRVLIVEDSVVLRTSLAQGLREAGYAVDAVGDGKRGLVHAQTTDYDVVVLDWMLPELDGLGVLTGMRSKRVDAAVLMLTARDAVDDRVLGLSSGADDYLVKPFAFKELLARVKALGRRRHGARSPEVRVGPLRVDTTGKRVSVEERAVELTAREYALVEYLALRQGKPVSRAELEEHLYDDRSQIFSNAIDATVYAVRWKLDEAGCPGIIQTRRRIGYMMSAGEGEAKVGGGLGGGGG